MAMSDERSDTLIRWIVDTSTLWPVPTTGNAKAQMRDFEIAAAPALSVLPPQERKKVLAFYHIKDARLALASHLLKHHCISTLTGLPLTSPQNIVSADEHHKPCFYLPAESKSTTLPALQGSVSSGRVKLFDFNVSHQHMLVSLVAQREPALSKLESLEVGTSDGRSGRFAAPVAVGTDIVCCNERLDRVLDTINQDGFTAWVDMHADVFHPNEIRTMCYSAENLNLPYDDLPYDQATAPAPSTAAKHTSIAADTSMASRTYNLTPISKCDRVTTIPINLNPLSSAPPNQSQPDVPTTTTITSTTISNPNSTAPVLNLSPHKIITSKLRRFYAHWALREAYIKMTGEALLAPWLQRLEFRHVRAPLPWSSRSRNASSADLGYDASHLRVGSGNSLDEDYRDDVHKDEETGVTSIPGTTPSRSDPHTLALAPGEIIRNIQVYFDGEQVTDVYMELCALGEAYMVATAVRRSVSLEARAGVGRVEEEGEGLGVGEYAGMYRILDLHAEVLGPAGM